MHEEASEPESIYKDSVTQLKRRCQHSWVTKPLSLPETILVSSWSPTFQKTVKSQANRGCRSPYIRSSAFLKRHVTCA